MTLLRILCVAYALLLSFFLLARDPTLGGQSTLLLLLKQCGDFVHFAALLTLTVLIVAARWPIREWVIVTGLVVYAVAAESLQFFVPPRDVEWRDALQNLSGVAVGLLLCRFARAVHARIRSRGIR